MGIKYDRIVFVLIALSLAFSSCTSSQATATLASTVPPTPTTIPLPPATTLPLPVLTLNPGDSYFSLDGKQSMIFSRNFLGPILNRTGADFKIALEQAHQAGTRLIRVHLTGWWGAAWMNNDGTVNETWAQNWDWFFDQTQAEGIYVLPVFGVCADWNDAGWKYNPLNQANGGYLTDPTELFRPGSTTQEKWMAWVQTLVQRWQGRKNILGWEIFSEINIASGAPFTPNYVSAVTEPAGVDFIDRAAGIIRAADTFHRPTTASLEGFDEWPAFLRSDAIDFLNIHPYPYPPQLDTFIIQKTHAYLATYHKPVLIGESGLSGAEPISDWGKITMAERAPIGIRHAIWAGVVSGAMNGRGLFWEDSYALAVQGMDFSFLEKYAQAETATAAFVENVDYSGFQPLADHPSARITGAALGNESMVLGWYRDAACEPPDWNIQPIPAGQKVTVSVPGTAAQWQVDYYDTKTGTTILSPASAIRQGSAVTVTLPEFTDDIAFKLMALDGGSAPAATTSDPIAGKWSGTITNTAGTFSTPLELTIRSGCAAGSTCGTFNAPQVGCAGDLYLQSINGETFLFQEQNVTGGSACKEGGYEQLQLNNDGSLTYQYQASPGYPAISTGTMKHP